MKKILIFISHTGGGHLSLGEALYDMLAHEYDVTLLDPQPNIINLHYRIVSRHALWLWEAEFKLSDGRRRARLVHTVSSLLLAERVVKALRQTDPDLVISTYPFLTSEVTYAMRRWKLDRPLVMLFSDPNGVHRSWLTEKRASVTFAPTRETYRQALNAGFDSKRLQFTGWPVRGQFYHAQPNGRARILNKLGFNPNKFTIFMQGGGEGAAKFAQTVMPMLELPNVQIILAAGTNEGLRKHFHGHPSVRPIPFTKQIAPYMLAADVVMGKAGPNMIFEAVTLEKPFIATAYIPGQEEVNLEFIQRYELGWVALDSKSQTELISALIRQPEKLAAMRASVERYQLMNTEAVQKIPRLVGDLLAKASSRD